MLKYNFNKIIYGINNPNQRVAVATVGLPEDPVIHAPIGTYYVNTAIPNVFVKGARGEWIDVAGGPGTGIFDSLTILGGNLTITNGDLQVGGNISVDGDLDIPNGDVISPDLNINTLLTVTNLVSHGTFTIDTGGFDNDAKWMPLLTDNMGQVRTFSIAGLVRDGATLIGAAIGQQAFTRFTSNLGSITFTYGANSIDMDVTDTAITTDFLTNSGTATETAGEIELQGLTNMETAAIGNIVSFVTKPSLNIAGSLIVGTTIDCGTTATAGNALNILSGDMDILDGNFNLDSATAWIQLGFVYWMYQEGTSNNFIGSGSGNPTLVTGTNNNGVGADVLSALTSGNRNNMFGTPAPGSRVTTTASDCIALGRNFPTMSQSSIAIGTDIQGTLSSQMIAIGVGAVVAGTNTNSVVINSFSGGMSGQNNNIMICYQNLTAIANAVQINPGSGPTSTNIGGATTIYTATVGGTNGAVLVSNAHELGTVSSSARYKQNIRPMDDATDALLELRPTTFSYKRDAYKAQQFGLIAEEVEQVFPYLVNHNDEGKPESVRYHELPVMILNELIKAAQRVDALSSIL